MSFIFSVPEDEPVFGPHAGRPSKKQRARFDKQLRGYLKAGLPLVRVVAVQDGSVCFSCETNSGVEYATQ